MPASEGIFRRRRKNSNGDVGGRGRIGRIAGIGQTWLAILIVVPAFVLIAYMLIIQHSTIDQAIGKIDPLNTNITPEQIGEMTNFFEEMNSSNQNMFSIMLSVFGAWVAAVVAFYFGTQSLRKSQESLDKAQESLTESLSKALSPEEKLSSTTVEQLLNEHPGAKNIISVTMQSTIKDVKQAFGDLSNVVVVDTNQKPLGVLYRMDFTDKMKARIEEANNFDNDPLQDHIEKIREDFATKNPWNKTTGVKNYAELLLSDNLQIAQAKMKTIGDKPAVRGIVVDSDGRAIGIVDYPMISSVLEKE